MDEYGGATADSGQIIADHVTQDEADHLGRGGQPRQAAAFHGV